MSSFNAVKFTFLVPRNHVKLLLDIGFNKDIQLIYPRLSTAPEFVKVKGLADILAFQEFYEEYKKQKLFGLDVFEFHKTLKFKFVEVNNINQPIPFAEKKEIIEKNKK